LSSLKNDKGRLILVVTRREGSKPGGELKALRGPTIAGKDRQSA